MYHVFKELDPWPTIFISICPKLVSYPANCRRPGVNPDGSVSRFYSMFKNFLYAHFLIMCGVDG